LQLTGAATTFCLYAKGLDEGDAAGINPNTAKTQFQHWKHSAEK